MESEFLKGLGKKAEAKPSGIMEKVAAGMKELGKEGSEKPAAKTEDPPRTEGGEIDHLASITEKVLGKEATGQETDALESIRQKMGLGEEGTKTAEDENKPVWQQKVETAFAEAQK